jgi:SPP1 gp7 family putative phage head morphogenesis protein
MPDAYTLANEFKTRLLQRERSAASELLRAYALATRRMQERIDFLTSQIDVQRRQGIDVPSSWLFERGRLENLKLQIQLEINRFAQVASLRVAACQHAAIQQGATDAQALVGEASGDAVAIQFGALNTGAVQAMAGLASDGSPLRALFAANAPRVAQAVSDELVAGVATGASVRVIAGRVRDVLGGELARALTISRTEVLRSYRSAGLHSLRAHGITQFRWLAARDLRTCLICLALDGQIFSSSEPMPAHINCRCTYTIVLPDQAPRETAAEWFAKQSEGAQKQMLGSAFEQYKQGKIQLSDFVGYKQSDRWGVTAYQRPLKEILTNL